MKVGFLVLIILFIIEICALNFNDNYEEVTQSELKGYGALERCGDGVDKGKSCVPYYQCDAKTNTVIVSRIDIRARANLCDHYLDVCCKNVNSVPQKPVNPIPPVIPTPPIIPTPSPPPTIINPDKNFDICGIRNNNGIDFKITGNSNGEAEYGEFPWMVAILKTNYNTATDSILAICGGSVLTSNVILTAAHCVYNYSNTELKIRAGEWDTQTEKERIPYQERYIAKIIIHENFQPKTLFNDFALIILENNLNFAENVAPICLPAQNQLINSENCFATGWGKNYFEQKGHYQVILKKIELPIVDKLECQNFLRKTRLGKFFHLDESFTCAGGIQGKDTCTGDGGSPLVCPDPNNPIRYIQAGIVAWGIGCGENEIPGVYGDVSKARNWIDDQLNKLQISTSSYH